MFEVGVVNTNVLGFSGENEGASIQTITAKIFADKFRFFLPTNQFCGPVELRDHSGARCAPLKPETSSIQYYPASFSLQAIRQGRPPPATVYPRPITVSSEIVMASFYVSDCFALKEPGAYTLTVWPKIYQRESEGSDLCHRVDLPPVVVSFEWTGEDQPTVRKGVAN
jgi:hypothetical protein